MDKNEILIKIKFSLDKIQFLQGQVEQLSAEETEAASGISKLVEKRKKKTDFESFRDVSALRLYREFIIERRKAALSELSTLRTEVDDLRTQIA